MCREILNKSFHTFPSLGNVFIIQLSKIHNIASQLDNLCRWVVLSSKSILAFIPRIYAIRRQGFQPLLSSPSQGQWEKLNFNYITIYFFVVLNITKLNKIIQVQSTIISSTEELLFQNKIKQSRFDFIGSC